MIEWTQIKQQYVTGYNGKINKYILFTIMWDAISGHKHPDGPYKLYCKLPGIKEYLGNFKNDTLAKDRANDVWQLWIAATGLIENTEYIKLLHASQKALLEKSIEPLLEYERCKLQESQITPSV